MTTLAFFNNKGGVGKTSLVYHLAWMYDQLGVRVVVADLDPQSNLTAMFLDEQELIRLWYEDEGPTVMSPIRPLLDGEGGIEEPGTISIGGIALVPGDLDLSSFEDELSLQWTRSLAGERRGFKVIGAFHEVVTRAARAHSAELILIDVGPNLGAINRAALIAADHVVVPLAPDLFSLQGLQNLGPRLRKWREGWSDRLRKRPDGMALPAGAMSPAGYVVLQHAVRLDRPVKAYRRWMERIPETYRRAVLDDRSLEVPELATDTECLATLKHYRSLMPLAQEARKPMFALRAADGAIGGHAEAVQACWHDFAALAKAIAGRVGIEVPSTPLPR